MSDSVWTPAIAYNYCMIVYVKESWNRNPLQQCIEYSCRVFHIKLIDVGCAVQMMFSG